MKSKQGQRTNNEPNCLYRLTITSKETKTKEKEEHQLTKYHQVSTHCDVLPLNFNTIDKTFEKHKATHLNRTKIRY